MTCLQEAEIQLKLSFPNKEGGGVNYSHDPRKGWIIKCTEQKYGRTSRTIERET